MKKSLFAGLILLCAVFAAAQEAQKMVSYFPTPYAVYDVINANEATINDKGLAGGTAISARSVNISFLDVADSLDVTTSKQINPTNMVVVGAHDANGVLTKSDGTPCQAGEFCQVGALSVGGVLRLNQTLGKAAGIVTSRNDVPGELHLIDTWIMHDQSFNRLIFPYAKPMNPAVQTMRWLPVQYRTDCPNGDLLNCDPTKNKNVPPPTRGAVIKNPDTCTYDEVLDDPYGDPSGPKHQVLNLNPDTCTYKWSVPIATSTFLVIDEAPNCRVAAGAWQAVGHSVDPCLYDIFTVPGQPPLKIPQTTAGVAAVPNALDTCNGNASAPFVCPTNIKTPITCWDLTISSQQLGGTTTNNTGDTNNNNNNTTFAQVYTYNVGVLVNYNQSPFTRDTLQSSPCTGNFDCHTGGDNAAVDPLQMGRGWDQFWANTYTLNGKTFGSSSYQRLKCQPWSFEFYIGGQLHQQAAVYKMVSGSTVLWAAAKYLGWDNGKIIGTLFLGNFPSLSSSSYFSQIGSTPYCPNGADMQKVCAQKGYTDYKCIQAITIPTQTRTPVLSAVADASGKQVSSAYSCSDQQGTATIVSCKDLNPAPPPASPSYTCTQPTIQHIDCKEDPTCSHDVYSGGGCVCTDNCQNQPSFNYVPPKSYYARQVTCCPAVGS
ncbi:MAG: hypothetical protein FWF35_02310 [Elusimicrobia bacterium]|nr:hypothetical protein [Elusimicrobiota bacterium]